ncbi:TIGR04086 family membrane protein [Fictibacillus iocasae]|uniref:TIGR04086 family membrane protein n=1 Tax=Fictibacillus iocasae TaxID=2715437 RepID=A0ABW2NQ24_9BACL
MEAKHMAASMLKGLFVILIFIIVSSVILSLILRFTSATEQSLKWVTLALSFVSMFAGGFLTGKKAQAKGWVLGAGTSMLFSLLVFLIQYLGYQTTFSSMQYLYHGLFMILCMIGGIMGVNFSSHSTYKN